MIDRVIGKTRFVLNAARKGSTKLVNKFKLQDVSFARPTLFVFAVD